ncbi:MAG: hypothetical protein JOZ12_15645 [Sinobacteraceae bacterium]|nr:hypothetical protein [Nevskiaceae bacterium]MBV8853682.1 hypothetical protein [Nevskiaceae bacterium]
MLDELLFELVPVEDEADEDGEVLELLEGEELLMDEELSVVEELLVEFG